MRELILMRHAEAVSGASIDDDFQRPLTPAGQAAAVRVARAISVEHRLPECIICSPALRTLATAQLLQQTLDLPGAIVVRDSRIYLAVGMQLRRLLAEIDDSITRLLVVGHNPGISQLLADLSPAHSQRALATAEYAGLPLPIDNWAQLAQG